MNTQNLRPLRVELGGELLVVRAAPIRRSDLFPTCVPTERWMSCFAYDWRDRLVATKSGVQSSENDGTNRPIYFYVYDNLDEATSVSQYQGDGVTLSTTAPSASLLRSYEVMSYDDQGRVYKDQVYDVNQSTGAKSSSALTTNYYYDHRGDQIAESDPGGLWTKDQFNGVGWLTTESETDGGSGTTWAQAGSLSGDQVLTQELYTYDNNGNVILQEEKDRFNTDTSSQKERWEARPQVRNLAITTQLFITTQPTA